MKRVLKNSVLISFLLFNGIAYSQEVESLNIPTEAVYELIKKYNLEEVDFNYVKSAIGNGNRNSVFGRYFKYLDT